LPNHDPLLYLSEKNIEIGSTMNFFLLRNVLR
jgi:hypothetical protein